MLAYSQLGIFFIEKKEFTTSIKFSKKSLSGFNLISYDASDYPWMNWFHLGSAYIQSKKYDEAIHCIKTSLLFHISPLQYYKLAVSLLNSHRYNEAKEAILKIEKIDKNYSRMYYVLASVESALKNYENAKEHIMQAIKLDASIGFYYTSAIHILNELEEYYKAIDLSYPLNMLYQKERIEFLFKKGYSFFKIKKYNQALICQKEIILLSKQFGHIDLISNTYLGMGAAYWRLGKIPEAVKNYKIALQIDPRNITVLIDLGNLYSDLKEYPKALNWFYKASQIYCSKQNQALELLGKTYAKILEQKHKSNPLKNIDNIGDFIKFALENIANIMQYIN